MIHAYACNKVCTGALPYYWLVDSGLCCFVSSVDKTSENSTLNRNKALSRDLVKVRFFIIGGIFLIY